MQTGPALFLAIAVAIIVVALVIGRLFRRTIRRPMPGSDRDTARGVWFGSGHDGD